MRRVAVLGGGPAGAMAAQRLAAGGVETVLIDEKLAWEKPCGGGITYKAYARYPFLNRPGKAQLVPIGRLRAEGAGEARLRMDKPLLIFSRLELNQILLNRASRAGARIWQTRVVGMDRQGTRWKIRTKDGDLIADFAVVATGARNPLKGAGTAFHSEDCMTAMGYFVPGKWPAIDLHFFDRFEGYIWVFPRTDHLSVGICGKGEPAQTMRRRLERYMAERDLLRPGSAFYGHALPSLAPHSWPANRLAGQGWVAAGDAGGLVDPVTGEGIYYAMRSGELAGDLLASGELSPEAAPQRYHDLVTSEFGCDLAYGSTLSRRLFLGNYLFGANTRRMVQLLRRSASLRSIVQDLFAGILTYAELRRKLKASMHTILAESVFPGRMIQEGIE